MTLCTHLWIQDRIEPMEVFAKCRALLDASDDIQVRVHISDGTWSVGNNLGQGLSALLDTEFRPGEPLRTAEQAAAHDEYCEDDCDGAWHRPAAWMEVSFDTTYSYRDEHGGCGHLHARLLADLGEWLSERDCSWCWENEFTGEKHEGFDGLLELVDGGESAQEWFSTRVLPAIARIAATQEP